MNKIKAFLKSKYDKFTKDDYIVNELILMVGLLTIIITNFFINIVFAMYFIGITLILLSIFLNKTKKAR